MLAKYDKCAYSFYKCKCLKLLDCHLRMLKKHSSATAPGGDSHLEISVIPMLGHLLYTREYSYGARAWQGFVAILSMYGWSHYR
jgi:hypothetical protein